MAPWTSLSLTIGYMPSKSLIIKDIQEYDGGVRGPTQTLGWRLKVEVDFAVGDPLWFYL